MYLSNECQVSNTNTCFLIHVQTLGTIQGVYITLPPEATKLLFFCRSKLKSSKNFETDCIFEESWI